RRFSKFRPGCSASPSTSRPAAKRRPSALRWSSIVNSPWSKGRRAAALAVLVAAALACDREKRKQAQIQAGQHTPQGRAQLLGRAVAEIVDGVMAYRSPPPNQLPANLRQAGVDSLPSVFIRHYASQGTTPVVTIRFRNTSDRAVAACTGTNQVLEDAMLHEGRFDVSCEMTAG